MEELQDALEDVHYVNEINVDEGPRPLVSWEKPTNQELEEWKAKLQREWKTRKDDPNEPLSFNWILQSPIGFFMFSTYLKSTCHDYLQINFIEEMIRWRNLNGRQRGVQLRRIFNKYLDCEVDEETKELVIPRESLIEEYDIALPLDLPNFKAEELSSMLKNNLDESNKKCCIGLTGSVYDEIIEAIQGKLQLASQYEDEFNNNQDLSLQPPGHDVASKNDSSQLNDDKTDDDPSTLNIQDESESKDETPKSDENEVPDSLIEDAKSVDNPKQHEELNLKELVSASEGEQPIPLKASRSYQLSTLPNQLLDKAAVTILEKIRRKYFESFKQSENKEWEKLQLYLWHKDRKVVEGDFYLMRVLGRGGFGLVTGCKRGTTGKLYAMKVMNKKRIKAKKAETLALNERDALAAVESPFVLNLKYSFQSNDDVFLILDLMTGGDLSFHLSQKGRFPKEQCLYYAARIMLGLQALHDKNYVYRDLKPENCLLDETGRVKITDLGLAVQVTSKLSGAAGTRGYWAPEMLMRDENGKRLNYDQKVDWFSFGCLVAEMISGTNPFRSYNALQFGQEHEESKDKALDYATMHMEPTFESRKYTPVSIDLCKRLLEKDPKKRLGANGCDEIMAHPWFDDVNWDDIISDRIQPPFVPLRDINAGTQSEIGTFANDKEMEPLTEKENSKYEDWDWTNPIAFSAEVIEILKYERDTGKPVVPMHETSTCCCVVM